MKLIVRAACDCDELLEITQDLGIVSSFCPLYKSIVNPIPFVRDWIADVLKALLRVWSAVYAVLQSRDERPA
jgi:hypothetical protein